MVEHIIVPSPFGRLVVAYDDEGRGYDSNGQLTYGAVVGLTIDQPLTESAKLSSGTCGFAHEVRVALYAYLAGDDSHLNALGTAQTGGEFFQAVWQAMRRIPSGETRSYAELATMAGRPRAIRAAASACARNAIPLIVPCHRVVTSSGAIGNYFCGPAVKQSLLSHESGTSA